MNSETTSIKEIIMSESLSGQQSIEADIVLPDYYNSIGKIIKCDIEPITEAVNMNSEKISIAGNARLTLLYIGEDKKLYSYENDYKYTKVFQLQSNDNGLNAFVRQNVFSLNYRALAPKRIEVRGIIQLALKLTYINEIPVISEADDSDIITKNSLMNIYSPVASATREFTVSQEFSSAEINDNIGIIIRKNCRNKINEMKSIHNKLYIKGSVETEITYVTENENSVKNTILSVPFSEVLDMFGIEENDIIDIFSQNVYADVKLKDEASASLELRCNVSLNINVFRYTELTLISDAYSLKNSIISNTKELSLIKSFEKLTANENISFEADASDLGSLKVCDAFVDNIKVSPEIADGKATVLITALFNAIVKDNEENLSVISREHTAEAILSNASDKAVINCNAKVLSISALQTSGGKIRFNCDIFIEFHTADICKTNCFTELLTDSSESEADNERVIVYFAQKGEELWSIAKENRTSVRRIKEVNQLSSEHTTENSVLILPTF